MSLLPSDILEEIVETIGGNDTDTDRHQTLYTMSLTCRYMLSVCRKQLFYEMILVPRSWDGLSYMTTPKSFRLQSLSRNPAIFRIKTVERLLESSPDILQYVRKLDLQSDRSNYNDTGLHALLQKFTNLQSLSIEARQDTSERFPGHQPHRSWNSLPPLYQRSLVQLIHVSPLRSLSFHEYKGIPFDIFLRLGGLVNLSLKNITFTSSSVEPATVLPSSLSNRTTGPLQLKELWFSSRIEALPPLLESNSVYGHPIIDPTALELLIINLKTVTDTIWNRDVLSSISNLEFLFISDPDVSYQNYLSDVLHGLHLHSITSLVFLRYDIAYDSDQRPLPSSVICDFKFDSLETLELHLGVHRDYERRLLEDLSELDKIIESARFPALKHLRIQIANTSGYGGLSEVEEWESASTRRFERISANTSIDFDYFLDYSFEGS